MEYVGCSSMSEQHDDIELPLITIGMPIKNRAWCLPEVLSVVETVDYPKYRIKVIFVDDYSTDGSYEIIEEWVRKAKGLGFYKVEVIQARTNIPQARNICVKHMEGKYLLFWDSDVIPPPDLLREMVEAMERNPGIGILGTDYVYDPSTDVKPVTNKETHAVYMGFTLLRRDIFEKTGMFNENLSVGEDTEFCIRMKEKTNYHILWTSKPALHLKRLGDVKRKGLVKAWLKYNFNIRAEEYYRSFKSLPRFLKIRILYYIGLPWVIVITLIAFVIKVQILAIVLPIYLVPSVYLVIRQGGLKDGITTWIKFNIPTGLALSYGVLRVTIKSFLKLLNLTSRRNS